MSATAVRYVRLPRVYLREVVTTDDAEHVIESRPVTKAEAESQPLITPPDGYREREEALTTRRALLRLLTSSPNRVVTHAEVCAELGRIVSPKATSKAAISLRRDMPIEAFASGGYMFLLPVPAHGPDTCETCAAHAYLGCRRLGCRPVADGDWCGAWRAVLP